MKEDRDGIGLDRMQKKREEKKRRKRHDDDQRQPTTQPNRIILWVHPVHSLGGKVAGRVDAVSFPALSLRRSIDGDGQRPALPPFLCSPFLATTLPVCLEHPSPPTWAVRFLFLSTHLCKIRAKQVSLCHSLPSALLCAALCSHQSGSLYRCQNVRLSRIVLTVPKQSPYPSLNNMSLSKGPSSFLYRPCVHVAPSSPLSEIDTLQVPPFSCWATAFLNQRHADLSPECFATYKKKEKRKRKKSPCQALPLIASWSADSIASSSSIKRPLPGISRRPYIHVYT